MTFLSGTPLPDAASTWILSIVVNPSTTLPKITCLPLSHYGLPKAIKNWELLVSGPQLAMASIIGSLNRKRKFSSSNLSP